MTTKKKAGSGAEREAARRARQAANAPAPVEPVQSRPVWIVGPPVPGRFSGTSRRDRLPADQVAVRRLRARVKSVAIMRQRLEAEVLVRDRYVAQLRTLGWSWERIASEAGVSRQALTKRVKKA